MRGILGELNEINQAEHINDDAFQADRRDEKADTTQTDFEIAKLKAKIKNLQSDIEYKNKKYEKLFSFYYDRHEDEVADIIKNNLLKL